MASVSRTAQFAKLHKVLKKCYKPVALDPDRSVLDHLLFASCLEEARYEEAEVAFAALVHTFYDWNEVRVTSISELSEVMASLPDPRAAANRLKRVLHAIFEETYSFDLEDRRKKNLGPTIQWFEKLDGTSPFSVAYVVQAALGGHAIPIDTGTMRVLRLLDLVSEEDAAKHLVPGLERAIPKSKGVEFGSLLHQLGADFTANPYSPGVREILLQISPEIQDRLPRRRAERPPKLPAAEPSEAGRPAQPGAGAAAGTRKKADGRPAAPGQPEEAAAGDKPPAVKKRPAAEKKLAAAHEAAADPAPPEPEPPTQKSAASGLAKRKPR
jgi:endonuclease-3